MRWDVVVDAWLGLVTSDTDVQSVLGEYPEFWMAGDREHEVPSLEYSLISNGEGELWEVSDIQLDLFTRSIADLVELEKALRRLLHHDLPIEVSTGPMWSQFRGSRGLSGPSDGVLRRGLDFRLTYLRDRYS